MNKQAVDLGDLTMACVEDLDVKERVVKEGQQSEGMDTYTFGGFINFNPG